MRWKKAVSLGTVCLTTISHLTWDSQQGTPEALHPPDSTPGVTPASSLSVSPLSLSLLLPPFLFHFPSSFPALFSRANFFFCCSFLVFCYQ